MTEELAPKTPVEESAPEADNSAIDALSYDDGANLIEEPLGELSAEEPKEEEGLVDLPVDGKDGEEEELPVTPAVDAATSPSISDAAAAVAAQAAKAALDAQSAPQKEEAPAFDSVAARKDLVDIYAKKYTISEEDITKLATAPEEVLPRMIGEATVDAYEAVYHTLVKMAQAEIPKMIAQYMDEQKTTTGFYSAHPTLAVHLEANPDLRPQVAEAAAFWRKQNPNGTPEEAVAGIGALSKQLFGLKDEDPVTTSSSNEPKPKLPRKPAGVGSVQAAPDLVKSAEIDALFFEQEDN